MSEAKIKNCLLTVVRALATLIWLIASYIQRRLTDLRLCSRLNPYLGRADERERAVQQILNMWGEKSNWTIANDRRAFEDTNWGQQVIRSNPDRHLYAVLYPSRKENLKRIANVLQTMDAEAFAGVMRNAKKMQYEYR